MEHLCKRCGYATNRVANLKTHLRRKDPCIDKNSCGLNCETLLKELEKDTSSYPFCCEECNLRFMTRQGKNYHRRNGCKSKPSDDKDNITIIKENRHNEIEENKRLVKLEQEVTLLKETLNFKATTYRNMKLELQFYKNKVKRNEDFYQMFLEPYLGGTHKILSCGVTDITTDDMHAEIKEWKCWKEAVGQLTVYNTVDPKQNLRLYFFGKYANPNKKKAIEVCLSCGFKPFEFQDTIDGISIIDCSSGKCVYNYNPTNIVNDVFENASTLKQ